MEENKEEVSQNETQQTQLSWEDILMQYKTYLFRLKDIEEQLKQQTSWDVKQDGRQYTINDLFLEADNIKIELGYIEELVSKNEEFKKELKQIKDKVKQGLKLYEFVLVN